MASVDTEGRGKKPDKGAESQSDSTSEARTAVSHRLKKLTLQNGIIYGPVRSRRLGLSLGINLLRVRSRCRPVCAIGVSD